jgi:serpin B
LAVPNSNLCQRLPIGDVIHQALIDVNEEGTEVAAATALVTDAMASSQKIPVPVFHADNPFIFIIQDDETGNILFMGRVNNPDSCILFFLFR